MNNNNNQNPILNPDEQEAQRSQLAAVIANAMAPEAGALPAAQQHRQQQQQQHLQFATQIVIGLLSALAGGDARASPHNSRQQLVQQEGKQPSPPLPLPHGCDIRRAAVSDSITGCGDLGRQNPIHFTESQKLTELLQLRTEEQKITARIEELNNLKHKQQVDDRGVTCSRSEEGSSSEAIRIHNNLLESLQAISSPSLNTNEQNDPILEQCSENTSQSQRRLEPYLHVFPNTTAASSFAGFHSQQDGIETSKKLKDPPVSQNCEETDRPLKRRKTGTCSRPRDDSDSAPPAAVLKGSEDDNNMDNFLLASDREKEEHSSVQDVIPTSHQQNQNCAGPVHQNALKTSTEENSLQDVPHKDGNIQSQIAETNGSDFTNDANVSNQDAPSSTDRDCSAVAVSENRSRVIAVPSSRPGETCLVWQGTMDELKPRVTGRYSEFRESFPEKLYRLIMETDEAGQSEIISFTSSGKAFQIHQPYNFMEQIIPKYFRNTQIKSFKRQLNMYGFRKAPGDKDGRSSFSHAYFQKGRPDLLKCIERENAKPSEKGPWKPKTSDM